MFARRLFALGARGANMRAARVFAGGVAPTRSFRWTTEKEPHTFKSAKEIVDTDKVESILAKATENPPDTKQVRDILARARDRALLKHLDNSESAVPGEEYVQGLTLEEAAVLLAIDPHDSKNDGLMQELFDTALYIKEKIYGNRIVLFAPLYLANYCVNSCTYCAFRGANKHVERSMVSPQELEAEVEALQRQGHRRLLVLTGESPKYTLDMFIDALHKIAAVTSEPCGAIRRINVEIPALSVSDYRRLKATDVIGTVTLFQETYHRPTFERVHPSGPKSKYEWRLQTMDRAQTAGIDDVGIGALFGLYDYRFEVLSMLAHAEHLDKTYGAGPHTVSIPRLRPADQAPDAIRPPAPVTDEQFLQLVAVLRCSVPYTGMILSTRESPEIRSRLLKLGISQMSAGSETQVGQYHEKEKLQVKADAAALEDDAVHLHQFVEEAANAEAAAAAATEKTTEKAGQFELLDKRPVDEIVHELLANGFVPSWCTACYRKHRTGAAFMKIAKAGRIQDFCHPNSLLTLAEYADDYAQDKTKKLAFEVIEREKEEVSGGARRLLERKMEKVKAGERDIYV